MSAVRVLVADDHEPFRQGLQRLLRLLPGVECAGEAADGEEAVRLALALQPDVVLMDLRMPGLDGVEATRRLREAGPHIGVLVLTMVEDDASVVAAVRAGARGYLLKGAGRAEIARALEAVGHGEALFGAGVVQRLAHHVAEVPAAAAAPAAPPFPQLSQREREVLELLGRGCGNQAIASRLHLSPKTVRNHVSHVLAKIGAADRADALIRAREAGLGGGR